MIPSEEQAKILWNKYTLSGKKRIHVQLVADVALWLATKLEESGDKKLHINKELLLAGALLHDIDKNIPRLPGETHPQTGVRILNDEGMQEVSTFIQYHSVQFIEDRETTPKSWEEKLLFLSDKMVKQEIITVDKRFELWLAEDDLPEDQKEMLRRVYPLVKALESEIFTRIGVLPSDVSQLLSLSKEA